MPETLPIREMSERHYALTPPWAATCQECASVCLERHHDSPTEIEIRNEEATTTAVAEWPTPDDRIFAAWANKDDATTFGAYACVIAAVELTERMVAVERAETKTGADYYIVPSGQELDLETALRLEIAGQDAGTESDLEYRLRLKLEQAERGQSNLPAMAGVIGFKARLILLKRMAA